jgi:hypothetical protein
MLPMKSGGALGKVISVVVVLAVLALVVGHPADAAKWTVDAFHLFARVVGGVSNFLRYVLG